MHEAINTARQNNLYVAVAYALELTSGSDIMQLGKSYLKQTIESFIIEKILVQIFGKYDLDKYAALTAIQI